MRHCAGELLRWLHRFRAVGPDRKVSFRPSSSLNFMLTVEQVTGTVERQSRLDWFLWKVLLSLHTSLQCHLVKAPRIVLIRIIYIDI
jgi:hypothetical protein